MVTRLSSLVFVGFAVGAATSAIAQAPARDTTRSEPAAITHMLRTVQGSTLFGRLAEDRPDTIRFVTSGGVLVVPRTDVVALERVDPQNVHNGEYWFPNHSSTRLFFGPTARTLRQGDGYYSNTYLLLNSGYVGVTDRLTIGGTVTLIPGSTSQIGYLTPKVAVYEGDEFNVAAGALLGYNGFDDATRQFGILYSVMTYGSLDDNVTAGIGWGYVGSRLARTPAVLLGGAARVSRRMALVTENYIVSSSSETDAVLGYGVRFLGEKLSVDLALLNSGKSPVFPGVPFVSVSVKF
jgi:hypothetical protein